MLICRPQAGTGPGIERKPAAGISKKGDRVGSHKGFVLSTCYLFMPARPLWMPSVAQLDQGMVKNLNPLST